MLNIISTITVHFLQLTDIVQYNHMAVSNVVLIDNVYNNNNNIIILDELY